MHTAINNRNLLKTKAYINGKWIEGKKAFPVLNPFDEKEIVKVADLGKSEALEAVDAAYRAFGSWGRTIANERAKKLYYLADLIEKNQEDLAFLLTLEQGKPLKEAQGEIQLTIDNARWLAEAACQVHGFTQCDPDKDRSVMTLRQPMGVVAAIIPWNFPFMLAVVKGFSALAAGCTVVLKPSEDTPLTALALAALAEEAQIPPGVFNVVTCLDPKEVGEVLTSHPYVTHLTFTGSTEVGKKLMAQCASTVKRVTMELGGNCPLLIFEDADLEKALAGAMGMKFLNAGQCCCAINRFLVQRSIYNDFVAQFTLKAKSMTSGSGMETVDLGPLINRAGKNKVDTLVADADQKGAKIVLAEKMKKGLLCSPIIIQDATQDIRLWKEEVFGPVAVFYPFDTEEQAIAMANDTRYGLAAYCYTENIGRALRVSQALETGAVGMNTTGVFSPTLPWGGWKESGLGREGGIIEVLNEYCELKSISFGK